MTLTYTLTETDFLTNQLYLASISERIKRKRKRARVMTPLIYLAFGVVLFVFTKSVIMGSVFISGAVLWFFIYPGWEKGHYFRHYQGFVRENHKARINIPVVVEINDDFIFARDEGSEGKINSSELEEIVALPAMFLIRMKTGQSIMLPKQGAWQSDSLVARLKALAGHLNIRYHDLPDWQWK